MSTMSSHPHPHKQESPSLDLSRLAELSGQTLSVCEAAFAAVTGLYVNEKRTSEQTLAVLVAYFEAEQATDQGAMVAQFRMVAQQVASIQKWHDEVCLELDAMREVAPQTYAQLPTFLTINQERILPDCYTNGQPDSPRGNLYGITNHFQDEQAYQTEQRILTRLWELRKTQNPAYYGGLSFELYLHHSLTPINDLCGVLYPLEAFASSLEPDCDGVTREILFTWIADHYQHHTDAISQKEGENDHEHV